MSGSMRARLRACAKKPVGYTVARARNLASAGAVAAMAACSIDAGPQARALSPGDSIPLSDLSEEHPTLVWVLDAQDCLGCELTGPAHSVRLLQRRLGDRMETVVVALSELGDEDRSLVTRFLDSQRVYADVRVRRPGEHVREFGQGAVPALYVVARERAVQALLEPGRWDLWRSPEDSLRLAEPADQKEWTDRVPRVDASTVSFVQ